MKQRPGVMVYFSIRPSLKRLTLEEKGALFEAILDYGQTGVLPDFDDVLGIAWDFIQPLIDADGEAYQAKCEKAKQAIETRWAKAKKDTHEYDSIRTYTDDTNYNTNSNFNTITNPIPKSITMAAEGEYEGETKEATLCKPIESPPPSDFESLRRAKLAAFNSFFKEGGSD